MSAPDDAAILLTATGLVRRYGTGQGSVDVLTGVDLTLRAGEVVALIGSSGSGKTTILNLLAGIDIPDSGEIHVCGERLADLSQEQRAGVRARCVGLVPQGGGLLGSLSALENVVVADLPWRPRADLEIEARELLAALQLDHRWRFRPAHLSGGERQRTAVARALLGSRRILLADEPTASLDRRAAQSLVKLLTRVARTRGTAVLLTTHDPLVARNADRVLGIREGRLEDAATLTR